MSRKSIGCTFAYRSTNQTLCSNFEQSTPRPRPYIYKNKQGQPCWHAQKCGIVFSYTFSKKTFSRAKNLSIPLWGWGVCIFDIFLFICIMLPTFNHVGIDQHTCRCVKCTLIIEYSLSSGYTLHLEV